MNDVAKTARAGGRGARRALRAAPDFEMLPALKRGIPVCEVMGPERVEQIDNASMSILEEVGVVFRDDIALADWKRAGAKVVGERVYLDRGLVRELISTIPWEYPKLCVSDRAHAVFRYGQASKRPANIMAS